MELVIDSDKLTINKLATNASKSNYYVFLK